jgi:hypothetical protein
MLSLSANALVPLLAYKFHASGDNATEAVMDRRPLPKDLTALKEISAVTPPLGSATYPRSGHAAAPAPEVSPRSGRRC